MSRHFHPATDANHHHGSLVGQYCQGQAQEITVELILCKYSRHRESFWAPKCMVRVCKRRCFYINFGKYCRRTARRPACAKPWQRRWAEAPIKIARMTLTIKLDGNWSSFQLANSAPPLSVTDSAIAPSARMEPILSITEHIFPTELLGLF